MTTRSFLVRLAPLALLGLALRLVYSLVIVKTKPLLGDGLEFHNLAYALADHHRYAQPSFFAGGKVLPTADKPPLWPLLLAVFTLLFGHGWIPHQVAGALVGTGTVVLVGLLGRRVGGDRVGFVAAALAAVYPLLIAADGSFRSEGLYALLITATLLSAYALRARPTLRYAVVCGVLIALATLTRSEALALVVLLVLPVTWRAAGRRRSLVLTGVSLAAAVVVLAPWLVRCWVQFDRPVYISTNSGGLLAGANCDATYHGDWLGQWRFDCLGKVRDHNEAAGSAELARHGIDYAKHHAGRLPIVIAARLGRSFELYRTRQQWGIEHFFEGRDLRVEQAGVGMYFVLALLAIVGAFTLRRRGSPLWILATPFLLVVIVAVTAYGFTRLRIAAEPALVVLAAVALVTLLERRRSGPRAAPSTSAPAG